VSNSNEIFRKSSLERVSSPEKLNEYIKVTSPSLIAILAAIFFILIAGFFWMFSSNIPKYTKIPGVTVTESGVKKIYSYVDIGEANRLSNGMSVAFSPEYLPREQFGYINGTIINIGKDIINEEYLYKKFKNPEIIKPILKLGNLLEVETLLTNWSNEKTKDKEILDGSVGTVSIVIGKQKAYELIFNS
jgi:hypothetical protein